LLINPFVLHLMFNPAFRYQPDKIHRQADEIIKSPFFPDLLQHLPVILLIINDARQVVYVNKDLLTEASIKARKQLMGQRPGECLDCIHASEGVYGCGSTAYCRVCGFANSIKMSEMGSGNEGECVIALSDGESLTLNVLTRPFHFKQEKYVFCSIEDVSDRKAREMLESIFLHDLQNTSAILSGLQEVYDELEPGELRKMLKETSIRINEEIQSYRLITSAENKTLVVQPDRIDLEALARGAIESLSLSPRFRNRKVSLSGNGISWRTDKTLLRQVLINMIKNALEAGGQQETVEVSVTRDPGNNKVSISVRNQGVIPEDIQLQIFQKSFSTKGRGRGWGTYSIKLLTEKYLGGKAGFISNPEQGTVFTITIGEFS
jgi:hypothetical protein